MAAISSITGVSNAFSIGGSALSLVGLSSALVTGSTPPGIAGFLFDIPEDASLSLTAQITDHFTDSNASIQDHVAFDPVKITLTGKVGELVLKKTAVQAYVESVIGILSSIGALTPSQSAKAQAAIAEYNRLQSAALSVYNSFNSAYGVLSGEPALNNQQSAFKTFQGYFNSRALLTVETPWQTFNNMIIESFTADQDGTTLNESTFTVSFKQLRFAYTVQNYGNLVGRASDQASAATPFNTEIIYSLEDNNEFDKKHYR